MTAEEFENALRATLEDRRLSRGERRVLGDVLDELRPTPQNLALFRSVAFRLAREAVHSDLAAGDALVWLEDVVKLLQPGGEEAAPAIRSFACFSPGESCLHSIRRLFAQVKVTADVCVFTITDNRISDGILEAHRRGVRLRIITDDDKANDTGSDIGRLLESGVEVRMDRTACHMHHKFAIFDAARLLTGSYNWTRAAADHNEENFVVVGDAELLSAFQNQFDQLWEKFR